MLPKTLSFSLSLATEMQISLIESPNRKPPQSSISDRVCQETSPSVCNRSTDSSDSCNRDKFSLYFWTNWLERVATRKKLRDHWNAKVKTCCSVYVYFNFNIYGFNHMYLVPLIELCMTNLHVLWMSSATETWFILSRALANIAQVRAWAEVSHKLKHSLKQRDESLLQPSSMLLSWVQGSSNSNPRSNHLTSIKLLLRKASLTNCKWLMPVWSW